MSSLLLCHTERRGVRLTDGIKWFSSYRMWGNESTLKSWCSYTSRSTASPRRTYPTTANSSRT